MIACAPAPSRFVLGDQNPYSLKRHASNRVKPCLLFPWAAELCAMPASWTWWRP
jgi:hypothetical protein